MVSVEEVKEALNSIRPYLNEDGGDVEVLEVSDLGVVRIKMNGNCSSCLQKESTIKAGIETVLFSKFKELTAVEEII